MIPDLPDGWQSWPPHAQAELLEMHRQRIEDEERLTWLACGLDCDGQPHPGLPYRHARPGQRPPQTQEWALWLLLAGRGYGKTRTGAEWSWRKARDGQARGALVAPTAGDARDVMIEGESGIMACVPNVFRPKYEPSKRRLTYPNGAQQSVYSADEPDRLRGPQHHYAWCDELAAWKRLGDAWSNLELGLRLGDRPEVLATTTPRPKKLIVALAQAPTTHITRGSTYENLPNLAESFRRNVLARYEGTRLGRQELMAELLTDIEGALWTSEAIEADRIKVEELPNLVRVVVAIDPAVTSGESADDTGMVVAGIDHRGHAYVLDDLTMHDSPQEWARVALQAYGDYQADRIIAETNNGGDMVAAVLRAQPGGAAASFKKVTASRGKRVRAEPIAALYEQHRVHHVGLFPELEDQMTSWTPDVVDGSPDRMDALVWAVTELLVEPQRKTGSWSF